MDSKPDLSTSIIQDITPSAFSPSTSTSSGSFIDTLKSINLTTWLIIVIVLAFLGFNIFFYLYKGTKMASDVLNYITKPFTGLTGGGVGGQIVDVSAEGAKAVVNTTSGAVSTGLSGVQHVVDPNPEPSVAKASVKGDQFNSRRENQPAPNNAGLNRALHDGSASMDYEADEASSSIQGGGKSGWCFIGEDRGFRSCALVNEDDKCMSGNIFPSHDICVNPSLRA